MTKRQSLISSTTGLILLTMALAPWVKAETQTKIVVPFKHFSDDYIADITVSATDDVEHANGLGTLRVYDAKTKEVLITLESDYYYFIERESIDVNVKELPYGEQSLLIYDDVNFDDKPDLAIQDGNNSCYGGPSFQIYLAENKGFTHSAQFTELAQDYCGMFDADKQKKTHLYHD